MKISSSVQQLAQLTRLDELKVLRAERAVRTQRAEVATYLDKVQEIQVLVDQLNLDAQRVSDFLSLPATTGSPVRLNDAHARRHWVIYDREKEEYYLQQAQQDLAQAQANLSEKNQIWNRTRTRLDETQRLLIQAQRQQLNAHESAESLMVEELFATRLPSMQGGDRG